MDRRVPRKDDVRSPNSNSRKGFLPLNVLSENRVGPMRHCLGIARASSSSYIAPPLYSSPRHGSRPRSNTLIDRPFMQRKEGFELSGTLLTVRLFSLLVQPYAPGTSGGLPASLKRMASSLACSTGNPIFSIVVEPPVLSRITLAILLPLLLPECRPTLEEPGWRAKLTAYNAVHQPGNSHRAYGF